MIDWKGIIKSISPSGSDAVILGVAYSMPTLIETYEINTPLRQAHFLAQAAHESAGFKTTTEYASGAAYEGRIDLGNCNPGDGKRFPGRGIFQITGRSNQERAAKKMNILEQWNADPTILAKFPYAALTAGDYWQWRGLNAFADADDHLKITKLINGGTNGLADRIKYLARAKAALLQSASDSPTIAPVPTVDAAIAFVEAIKIMIPDVMVSDLQHAANRLTNAGLKIDGTWGPKTEEAIKNIFRKSNGSNGRNGNATI